MKKFSLLLEMVVNFVLPWLCFRFARASMEETDRQLRRLPRFDGLDFLGSAQVENGSTKEPSRSQAGGNRMEIAENRRNGYSTYLTNP
jgi:hypothetical protein